MLYCDECGEVFSEDEAGSDTQGYVPFGDTYADLPDEWLCPACGSNSIGQASKCEECGEFFAPGLWYDELCPACAEAKRKRRCEYEDY